MSIRQITIIGTGLIGGAFATGEPTSISVGSDGALQRGQVAHSLGLVEATALPVMVEGQAVAVLEFHVFAITDNGTALHSA